MRISLLILCIFASSLASFSQGVARLGSVELQIGEQTELIFTFPIEKDKKTPKLLFPNKKIVAYRSENQGNLLKKDSVHAEIIQSFRDTILNDHNQYYWAGEYIITFWDTGYFVIPPTQITWKDSVFDLNPILVHVIMPKVEPQKDIFDIREEFVPLPFHFGTWLKKNWLIILGVFLVLCFVIYLLILRKRRNQNQSHKTLTLEEKTILAIDSLVASRIWEKENPKRYYSELSFILRSFLSAHFDVHLLEKTSVETIQLLKQIPVHPIQIKEIQTVLEQSDLAKFAQSQPTEQIMISVATSAKEIVLTLIKKQENAS